METRFSRESWYIFTQSLCIHCPPLGKSLKVMSHGEEAPMIYRILEIVLVGKIWRVELRSYGKIRTMLKNSSKMVGGIMEY